MCRVCLTQGTVCDHCLREDRVRADFAAEARSARVAMRRAGIPASRPHGDPIVLWEGPWRLALPATGIVALAVGLGLGTALLDDRLGVDVALSVLGLSPVVGYGVRLLFGGVSRAAGGWAAAVCALGALYGHALGGGAAASTSVGVLGSASAWVAAHPTAALAAYATALAVAFVGAAGPRIT